MIYKNAITTVFRAFKVILTAATWVLVLGIWAWFGWLMGRVYEQRAACYRQPTVEEQQEFLAGQGYDVGQIDGIAGTKFNRALNDWSQTQKFNIYANRAFEQANGGTGGDNAGDN